MTTKQKTPALGGGRGSIHGRNGDGNYIALVTDKEEPRISTLEMAKRLGRDHPHTFRLVKDYREDFERLGKVSFQNRPLPSGQRQKTALLNEDQAYLLLAFSRNTAKVRELKVRMVQAFADARRAAQARQEQYLPGYHELHDTVARLADDSQNARFAHMNLNRLVNKAAGIEAGQRRGATWPTQSALIVAQTVAARAMANAEDGREAYQQAKEALKALRALLLEDQA